MDMNELRSLLSRLRQERGITVRALGKELGVSASSISHWETGRSEPRGFGQLQAWASFFGVDVQLSITSEGEDQLSEAVASLRSSSPESVAALAAYATALLEADDRTRALLVAQANTALTFVGAAVGQKKASSSK